MYLNPLLNAINTNLKNVLSSSCMFHSNTGVVRAHECIVSALCSIIIFTHYKGDSALFHVSHHKDFGFS